MSAVSVFYSIPSVRSESFFHLRPDALSFEAPFDPDLDQHNLKPEEQDDGSVDHYELNLVQNVEAGSIIAEWISVEEGEDVDPRFISMDKVFPAGKGTGIKGKNLIICMQPSTDMCAIKMEKSLSGKSSNCQEMSISIREILILLAI